MGVQKIFYILEGEGVFTAGNKRAEVKPNAAVLIPAGLTFTIENTGEIASRLLSRHWIITDADGKVQEVEGEGVVVPLGRAARGVLEQRVRARRGRG